MPWLLVLHICSLLLWCASLLYLPALIASGKSQTHTFELHSSIALSRLLFTQVATPLALLSIVSGTLIFFTQFKVDLWLILKLTLVSGLVLCHVLYGWLIIRLERKALTSTTKNTTLPCLLLALASLFFIVVIITVVLLKPS